MFLTSWKVMLLIIERERDGLILVEGDALDY